MSNSDAKLSAKAYRGGLTVALAQPVNFGVQLVVNVLLARYLTPQDFGLVVMVTAITNFALIFRDLGLGTVTIQQQHISNQQKTNLFWINVGVGFCLCGVVCLGASPIATIYNDPRLVNITYATSAVFAVTGLSVQHAAILRREMRFGALMVVDITALIFAGLLSVWTAVTTVSYWAIIIFNVIRPLINLVGVVLASRWVPGTFKRGHGTLGLVRRGLNIAGFDIVNYWSRNLDNVLIGGYVGASALGVYKKGYELLLLPINQLRAPMSAVALPALSRLQTNSSRLAEKYLDMVGTITLLACTVVTNMLLVDDWLVPLVLGEQWIEVVHIFELLSPVAVVQVAVGTLGILLITSDQTGRYFRWGLWHSITMVAAFVIGIQWGMWGLVIAYGVANVLAFVPSIAYCTRETEVDVGEFIHRWLHPVAACLVSLGLATILRIQLIDAGIDAGLASVSSAVLHSAVLAFYFLRNLQRYSLLHNMLSRIGLLGRPSRNILMPWQR